MLKGKTRQRKAAKKRITKPRITATTRAVRTAQLLAENKGLTMGAAMLEAGYSPFTASNPQQLTRSKGWQELLDEYLPQSELLKTHDGLLRASNLDHMIFADGPKTEIEADALIADKNAKATDGTLMTRDDILTDDDIRAMFVEKNCEVRRISRTERSRHVYFWAADNRARKDALDMAYKLRGTYAAEKHLHVGASLVELHALRNKELAALPRAPQLDTPDVE